MAKRRVFYSFHYDNDVFRVQQIRNIGTLEDDKPVSTNEWEQIKRGGDAAIKRWIDDNLKYKSCLIVLIGLETSTSRWVKYEIEKAWNDGKAVFGIYIHNLKCPRTGICNKGVNPFDNFTIDNTGKLLSSIVKCYNPNSSNAYTDIANNLENWIEEAINNR
ncbi:TIR domain-containing protein [Cytophagaceae bacterium DM2B3-1]|uniref:TIR domain-containing protein n=1 Tax=Xanthocytophaga flava TaxID=3048013 RepID=A0ABT7CXA9_9BACT|nr:TIR domain-containing protein [Xanthocytophaga flavus]MDJ1498406.1 TIR domain-containing protein [Xanthocytophaga flavus]